MHATAPQNVREKIGFGQFGNAESWVQLGYNADVGTSSETVWTPGAEYVWPAAAQQMEVVGGAQDTAAGTGIQQVKIWYLTTAFVEKSVILTMTGAVAVPTVVADIFRVQTIHAYRFGANAVAAGTINLRTLGGGTIYGQIAQGSTRSRDCRWTIPAGKTLFITSTTFSTGSAVGNKNVLFTTRATYDNLDRRLLGANNFMPYFEVLLQDAAFRRELVGPTRFPTGVDIKVSAISDSAGAICSVALRGFLMLNGTF